MNETQEDSTKPFHIFLAQTTEDPPTGFWMGVADTIASQLRILTMGLLFGLGFTFAVFLMFGALGRSVKVQVAPPAQNETSCIDGPPGSNGCAKENNLSKND